MILDRIGVEVMADTPANPQRRSPSQPKPAAGDESRQAAAADWGPAKKSGGVRGEVKLALVLVITLVAAFSFVVYRKFDALQNPLAAGETDDAKNFQPLEGGKRAAEEVDLFASQPGAVNSDSQKPSGQDEIYQGAPSFPETAPELAMSEPRRPAAIDNAQPRRLSIQPANLVEEMEEQSAPPAQPEEPPQQEPDQSPAPIGLFGEDPAFSGESNASASNAAPIAPLEFPAERTAATIPSEQVDVKQPSAPIEPLNVAAESPASNAGGNAAPLDPFPTSPLVAPSTSKSTAPPDHLQGDEGLRFAETPAEPSSSRIEVADDPFMSSAPAGNSAATAAPGEPAFSPAPPETDAFHPPVIVERETMEDAPWSPEGEARAAPASLNVEPPPFQEETPGPRFSEISPGTPSMPPAAQSTPAATPQEAPFPSGVRDESQFSSGFASSPAPRMEPIQFAPSESGPAAAPDFSEAAPADQPDPFAVAPLPGSGQLYTVRPGDNYWTISKSVYGTVRYFAALTEFNRDRIPDPQKMRPGMQISTPPTETLEARYPQLFHGMEPDPTSTTAAANDPGRAGFFVQGSQPHYRVGKGDTLTSIAQQHLGRASRWTQIHALNREVLPTPDSLKLGTVLKLPHDASQVALTPDAPVSR
jgi:nucleoid-associated protein YgaU